MLERCRIAESRREFMKYLEPSFLKQCSGELSEPLVKP